MCAHVCSCVCVRVCVCACVRACVRVCVSVSSCASERVCLRESCSKAVSNNIKLGLSCSDYLDNHYFTIDTTIVHESDISIESCYANRDWLWVTFLIVMWDDSVHFPFMHHL